MGREKGVGQTALNEFMVRAARKSVCGCTRTWKAGRPALKPWVSEERRTWPSLCTAMLAPVSSAPITKGFTCVVGGVERGLVELRGGGVEWGRVDRAPTARTRQEWERQVRQPPSMQPGHIMPR